MSLYTVLLFLHVVGAIALGVILCFELAAILGLQSGTTATQATPWLSLLRAPRKLARPAGPTVLLSGMYLSVTRWGLQGWIIAGLLAIVLIGALDAMLSARRVAAIMKSLESEDGLIAPDMRRLIRDPMLALSIALRMALFVGIVFLMCTKPGRVVSLSVIAVSLIGGYAVALPGLRETRPASGHTGT
jgi:hypothetical protein